MQNTKKHDTTTGETEIQEKGHQIPVAPVLSSPVRGSRDTSKHVSEVKHESHKDENRRDHAQPVTGIKNPASGITEKTEREVTTQADNKKSGSGPSSHPTPVAPVLSSPVRGSRDTSKHVSEVKHESHKDEYRRDHAQPVTGIKNPAGITGKLSR
jgi:hypothetical protein